MFPMQILLTIVTALAAVLCIGVAVAKNVFAQDGIDKQTGLFLFCVSFAGLIGLAIVEAINKRKN